MKNVHRLLFAVLALLAIATSLSAFAAVTASLDRDHIAPGESVRLLVQRDERSNTQPDISVLSDDFDVLARSTGTSVQIINGHLSSRTQVNLLLAPKHAGTLRIPPLQWDGEQSPALAVTVDGNGKANASQGLGGAAPDQTQAASSPVLLGATLDRKQTWVQAVAVLTVRLASAEALYEASLDLPASKDFLVRQLGKDVQTSESRNGRSYVVVERKYLLFPQRSGQLKVDGVVLDAQIADRSADNFGGDTLFGGAFGRLPLAGMRQPTRPLRVHADAVELTVLARPAAATAAHWLPAQAVRLTESWRPDNPAIHVGEPLTRHLHLAASGLTAAQLPDLAAIMPVVDGIRAYPDQGTLDDQPQGNSVLGSRDQDIALIASRPGRYTLPALRLAWWDTEHGTQREVALPERTLEVLPAPADSVELAKPLTKTSTPSPAPMPAPFDLQPGAVAANLEFAAHSPWPWISLVVGLLWLATLLAWWYSRHRQPRPSPRETTKAVSSSTIPAAHAFKAFRKACQENDPQAARAALLNWAAGARPQQPPQGLKALALLLKDPAIGDALQQLDRCCYAGGEWEGKLLATILPTPRPLAAAKASEAILPGLYP
ncbi:BatD family protein [Candidatus Accumulibacter sp. ACC003]|uniref:BatD family protein n=1 Tax=Candidatus Accumulibacter sp. ACC003 TaxID=2823334 RepID=UPI0025C550D1|nr:BatD family protein [Candidatus Accumulibacter sp. ACC003]